MKKHALAALFCALLAYAPFSYSEALEEVTLEKIKSVEVGEPKSPPLKRWTIAVYMNGKSNIEPFALADLNRFETAGSDDNVNIVAEIGRSKGLDNDTQADGDWSGVRRYYVRKDGDKERIASDLVAELGNPDMGDWKEAASFLKWAKEVYPAQRYMFIIWDHGWGWIDPQKPGENLLDGGDKSISHDFVSGNYIKTTELSKIFRQAGRVDLYASMACFMQMAEVAYEIRDYADVIAGSEEVIQLPSFNFEDFFTLMLGNPDSDAEKAGVFLVDTFREMYARPEYQEMLVATKYGTQLSAIRGAGLNKFGELIKKISETLKKYPDTAALARAKTEVLRFEVGDESTDPDKLISFYADICHFLELVEKHSDKSLPGYPELKSLTGEFRTFLDGELVIKNVYSNKDRTGKDYSNTHGISMHVPGKPGNLIGYYPTYGSLAFEKATRWSETVKYLETVE